MIRNSRNCIIVIIYYVFKSAHTILRYRFYHDALKILPNFNFNWDIYYEQMIYRVFSMSSSLPAVAIALSTYHTIINVRVYQLFLFFTRSNYEIDIEYERAFGEVLEKVKITILH